MSDEIKNLGNETRKAAAASELSESELDAVAGGDQISDAIQQVTNTMQAVSNILSSQHEMQKAIIQNIRG